MTAPTAAATVADALSRFRSGEAAPTAPAAPTPTTAPTTAARNGQRVPYPRPNGQTYYGRSLQGDLDDVSLLRRSVGETVLDNIFVLFHGDPGTGKTAAVEAAFPKTLITLEGDGDTTVDDLVGSWVQLPDGTYEWADGPLVIAAEGDGERGFPLLIDEIALIEPKVLAAAYAAMDGRGQFRIKQNPRRGIIKVRPGFTVVGACNPNAPGAHMSEALLSRFTVHVEATTDYDLAKSLGVQSKLITVAKNLAAKRAEDQVSWQPQMRELLAFKRNEERFGMEFAVANLIGVAPEDDRPIVADLMSRRFGAAVAPLRQGAAALV